MVYLFFRLEVLRLKDRIGVFLIKSFLISLSGVMFGFFYVYYILYYVNNYNLNCFEVMFFIFYRVKVICFNFF